MDTRNHHIFFYWCWILTFSIYATCFVFRVHDDDEDEDDQNGVKENQDSAVDPSLRPYRLWYTLEVQASAPPPERTLEVTCAAHSAVAVDIAVTNPTRERIVMQVLIEGVALSGEPAVTLHPRQQVIYQVTFAPTMIGGYTGRWENCFIWSWRSVQNNDLAMQRLLIFFVMPFSVASAVSYFPSAFRGSVFECR